MDRRMVKWALRTEGEKLISRARDAVIFLIDDEKMALIGKDNRPKLAETINAALNIAEASVMANIAYTESLRQKCTCQPLRYHRCEACVVERS